MIFAVILLSIFLTISCVALYYSVKKNLEMIQTLENSMEQVEDSLEILEICKNKIEKKLKIDVLSDEPIIRELIEDIKLSKYSVLLISEKLSGIKEDLGEKENEESIM